MQNEDECSAFISPERKFGEEKHLHHHVHLLIQEYRVVLLLRRVSFIISPTLFTFFSSSFSSHALNAVRKELKRKGRGEAFSHMSDFFLGGGGFDTIDLARVKV